jgi:glycosyltransferase involved in cell wall biosynthesis
MLRRHAFASRRSAIGSGASRRYDSTVSSDDQPRHILHVAMPFALSGSGITNVIRELVAEHSAAGGRSSVVLSHNRETVIDGTSELYVDHAAVVPREFFTAAEMRWDHLAGLVGAERPYTPRLAKPAIQAARLAGPDAILIHEGHYATSSLPAWRRAFPTTRIVLYVHSRISLAYRNRELTRLLDSCDDVVFVSDFLRRATVARTRTTARTHVILNGARPAEDLGFSRSVPPTILFVGQLAPHKGAHLLVEALNRLHARGRDVAAVFIGAHIHGPAHELSDYERGLRAAAAPLGDRVEFRGFVPHEQLGHAYRTADLFCFPSTWDEPCGLVLLEAMSNGTASIASRRGGIPEIGADAVAYFDDAVPGALAEGIERLLDDPAALSSLRAHARRRAAELTWTGQYRLLMDVLSQRTGRRSLHGS